MAKYPSLTRAHHLASIENYEPAIPWHITLNVTQLSTRRCKEVQTSEPTSIPRACHNRASHRLHTTMRAFLVQLPWQPTPTALVMTPIGDFTGSLFAVSCRFLVTRTPLQSGPKQFLTMARTRKHIAFPWLSGLTCLGFTIVMRLVSSKHRTLKCALDWSWAGLGSCLKLGPHDRYAACCRAMITFAETTTQWVLGLVLCYLRGGLLNS